MIALKQEKEVFILKFTKKDVSEEFLAKLLSKYEIDQKLNNNQMSQEDAWDISEEIKENWYNNNKEWILKKIGANDNEHNS